MQVTQNLNSLWKNSITVKQYDRKTVLSLRSWCVSTLRPSRSFKLTNESHQIGNFFYDPLNRNKLF